MEWTELPRTWKSDSFRIRQTTESRFELHDYDLLLDELKLVGTRATFEEAKALAEEIVRHQDAEHECLRAEWLIS